MPELQINMSLDGKGTANPESLKIFINGEEVQGQDLLIHFSNIDRKKIVLALRHLILDDHGNQQEVCIPKDADFMYPVKRHEMIKEAPSGFMNIAFEGLVKGDKVKGKRKVSLSYDELGTDMESNLAMGITILAGEFSKNQSYTLLPNESKDKWILTFPDGKIEFWPTE